MSSYISPDMAKGHSVEERIAHLEKVVGPLAHFIGTDLRPDLNTSSLKEESDQKPRKTASK